MKLHTSGEDYLKTIYILQQEKERVRSMDAAERMGVSKPSVSHAVKLLRKGGYIMMDDNSNNAAYQLNRSSHILDKKQ